MSGIAEPACLLTACLPGPADKHSSTTDAPGQWSRSSYGTDSLENYADKRVAGCGVSCSFRAVFSILHEMKETPAQMLLSSDSRKNRLD